MAARFSNPSLICSPCLRHLHRCCSTAATSAKVPASPPPSSAIVNLSPARRLVALHGLDAPKYLQGITTTNIPLMQHTQGSYSAILNAQGRVLFDIFIYPVNHSSRWRQSINGMTAVDAAEPAFFLECDAAMAQTLVAHIQRYKLRSKFTVREMHPGEWDVWGLWNDEPANNAGGGRRARGDHGCLLGEDAIGGHDGRAAPHFCTRLVLPEGEMPEVMVDATTQPAPVLDVMTYDLRRYLHGVAEGSKEIVPGVALPQESNMDYMGGIDFRKGCYVGQELTIRTHHRGVVRKRILPVQIYLEGEEQLGGKQQGGEEEFPIYNAQLSMRNNVLREGVIPAEANIAKDMSNEAEDAKKSRTRSAGKFLRSIGNVGLALCRLEHMAAPGKDDRFYVEWNGVDGRETGKPHKIGIKAFVPGWHLMGGAETNVHPTRDSLAAGSTAADRS